MMSNKSIAIKSYHHLQNHQHHHHCYQDFCPELHLHGESHEDGAHHPGGIVPLPDHVLVRLPPCLVPLPLPQVGVGQVRHLLNLQILLLDLQLSFYIVFSFLVGPIILIAWKPKKVSETHTPHLLFLDMFEKFTFDFDLFDKFTCNCQ